MSQNVDGRNVKFFTHKIKALLLLTELLLKALCNSIFTFYLQNHDKHPVLSVGGGDSFFHFSQHGEYIWSPGVFSCSFIYEKWKYFWKFKKINFYLPPVWKNWPPIIWQKMKITLEGPFIDQMNRFDALIKMQKTSALCKVPFLKKSIKTSKNDIFGEKNGNFEVFTYFS